VKVLDPITQMMLVSAGTSFVTTLASKGANGPIQELDNLWELIFGNFHLFTEKKKALLEQNLIDYKNKIANEVIKIPLENIQEPPLNIIGPAFEASKFFIEDKVIRDMFAKVVASSMDNKKSNEVHSSYIEIIKQLSPLDAQNLIIIKQHRPIVEFRMQNENKSYKTVFTNVYLSNENTKDVNLNAISLSNISRLGLATITYDEFLFDESFYSIFNSLDIYKIIVEECNKNKIIFDEMIKLHPEQITENKIDPFSFNIPFIRKGKAYLTPLGKSFVKICC
jgi:hypothetical protein